jgi:hypothetical protein
MNIPRMVVVFAPLAIAIALSGTACSTPPSRAWCTNATSVGGADCAYDTFEQCRTAISGLSGGTCTQNPRWKIGDPPSRRR